MHRLWLISVSLAIAMGVFAAHTAATLRPQRDTQSEAASSASCRIGGPATALTELPEASGLAASRRNPGVLWSHNDSGEPVVFAVGANGSVKGRVRIAGAEVDDWEDVAVGPCPSGSCLYVADIGDNGSSRSSVTVYRVPEPSAGDETSAPAETFHATYPDGARDAEGLFVTSANDLFIVSKDEPVAVYRFPRPVTGGSTVRLQRVATLGDLGGRVTAASASPDGRWIAARTHRAVIFYRAPELLAGKAHESLRFDVSELREPQGEGVAILSDGTVFLSGEGGRGGTLARITCTLPH